MASQVLSYLLYFANQMQFLSFILRTYTLIKSFRFRFNQPHLILFLVGECNLKVIVSSHALGY